MSYTAEQVQGHNNDYIVYVCGIKDCCDGVEIRHVDAKAAAESIAFDLTGIQRVKYLGTVKGCSQNDIHVYQDEKGWIYNVQRSAYREEAQSSDIFTLMCREIKEERYHDRSVNKVFEKRILQAIKYAPLVPGLTIEIEKKYQVDEVEIKRGGQICLWVTSARSVREVCRS